MKSKECIEPRIDSPLTLKEFKELNAGIEIDGKNESPNSGSSWYKKPI